MKIEFSNEEVRELILIHAKNLLNGVYDDCPDVEVSMSGYSSYNVTATVSFEKRAPELKAAA